QSANQCCDYRHDAILKQFQATPPLASIKAVEEICVTCGGAHSYYQCLTANGNTFPEFRDNIQGYVSATAINYNQGNFGYRPLGVANQIRSPVVPLSELEKINKMNEINIKTMHTQINNVKNELRNEMKTSIQASMSNQTNELKNMMASLFQMNTASTSGLRPHPSNTIANPKGYFNGPGTRDPLHPNISYPSRIYKQKQQDKDKIQIHKFWQMFKQLHINITIAVALILIPKYHKMLKAPISNKEKLLELANTPLNENCSAVILKKLPEKLRDLGKFLIPCGFSKLKCKALADLGASINLMPLSVWKKLERSSSPLILGRPFLLTARALIDVYGEEMILRDGDERLTLNMRHNTSSYSNQPQKESINVINIYDDSCEDYLEDFTTSSSSPNHLLKEFTDELALITFSPRNDDLSFDIESHLREIEYLLNHDPTKEMDSILEDSVDKDNLADPNDYLVDTILEMFTDEHALDYSSLSLYDEYDYDLVEVKSDNDDAYNDLFDSKEDKINESKLLIDEHDLPRSSDFLPSLEYDSFLFEDFFEDFDPLLYELPFYKEVPRSKTLFSFSSESEGKVFKPEILTSK
nr:reverse transcriptase domain-containing protein [Tanacetum cinerariifolium]